MRSTTSRSYDDMIQRKLREDPEFAVEYLKTALEDTDEPKVLLIALRRITEARGGFAKVARAAGIERMVTISTRVRRQPEVLAIADRFAEVYCSLGTHPHYAHEELDVTPAELRAKRAALGRYETQRLTLDWFLDAFARSNEVFSRPADPAVARIVGIETIEPGTVLDVKDGLARVRVGRSRRPRGRRRCCRAPPGPVRSDAGDRGRRSG